MTYQIRHLTDDEMKARGKGRRVVASVPALEPIEGGPLNASRTYEAMVAGADVSQAVKWLRAVMPQDVAHLSDDEIARVIRKEMWEATERVTRKNGMFRPITIGGSHGA